MKTPSPPPAPDPLATANAQAGMNRDTAVAQQMTNMVNQVNPDGALKYNQTGSNTYVGADGKTVTIPQFTATTQLSAANQGIYDTGKVTEQNLANIGRDQSAKIGAILGTNVNLNNDAVEGRLMDLATKRLNPRFARDEDALRTRLSNSGIKEGSQAWNAEMGQMGQTRNDAINQLLLSGRQQSINEILLERQTPINEISALMSGSQVGMPTFGNTPQSQVAGVDYAGLVNQNYQAQLAAHNAKAQSKNAMLGGLFGLGGTLGASMMKFSDRRLKTNIRRVGKLDNGIPVYLYLINGQIELGVLADEVATVHPQAVITDPNGLMMVDYSRAVEVYHA